MKEKDYDAIADEYREWMVANHSWPMSGDETAKQKLIAILRKHDEAEAVGKLTDMIHEFTKRNDDSRCAICGWPLAKSRDDGCMRGDCSMRPFPTPYYDDARARREYAPHPLPGAIASRSTPTDEKE